MATVPCQWPDKTSGKPFLVQIVHTAFRGSEPVNGHKIKLLHPSLSGNTLFLCLTWPSALTISSLTTDQSQNFALAGSAVDNGDMKSAIYYLENATAGTVQVTATFSGTGDTIHFSYGELCHVATSSSIDDTAGSTTSSTAGAIQPGTVTTTQADDFLLNYAISNYGFPGNNQPYTAIAASNTDLVLAAACLFGGNAVQVGIKATAGDINPSLTVANPDTYTWNSIVVAFKANAAAGTEPSGMRAVHAYHVFPTTNASAVKFPCTGNLILLQTTHARLDHAVTSISDSETNSYTMVPQDTTNYPQIFYAADATPSYNLILSWTEQSADSWYVLMDVAGAATAPYDTTGFSTGTQGAANEDVVNAPLITPTTVNGLIVAMLVFGTGPPSAALTSGMIMDSLWATGMTDGSTYNSGDGYAHFWNTTTSQVAFDWSTANGVISGWYAIAASFKAAPSSVGNDARIVIRRA